MDQFFTYRLFRAGRIVRIGKGKVTTQSPDAIETYLDRRGYSYFSEFDYEWHFSESAAFKKEQRLTDGYERVKGRLPPRNAHRGGGGGRVTPRCKAFKNDGVHCMNLALPGNYGCCGVHR